MKPKLLYNKHFQKIGKYCLKKIIYILKNIFIFKYYYSYSNIFIYLILNINFITIFKSKCLKSIKGFNNNLKTK